MRAKQMGRGGQKTYACRQDTQGSTAHIEIAHLGRVACGVVKCLQHERVAGQDRHVLAEDLVARRHPAPHRVIVHGGEVVVH